MVRRQFFYDRVGNLIRRIDQKNQITDYFYTDLHFLKARDYPFSPDDHFTYDLSGRMLTAERGGWLVTFDEYDGANRVKRTTQNGRIITYDYDIPGRTRLIVYPGGREVLERTDFRGRLRQVNDPNTIPELAPIAVYSYDFGNRVLTRTYRNGTVARYGYHDNDWITSLDHMASGAGLIAGFGHQYDKEGNKKCEEHRRQPARSEGYEYDALYRLVCYKVGNLDLSCTVPVPITQTCYDLDCVGNWKSKTTDTITTDPVTQTRSHNEANEITKIDAADIFHDDRGNLDQDERYAATYDEENRLIAVTRLSDNRVVGQYQYDALSRRIAKTADPDLVISAPVTTLYFHDDARIIEEQNLAAATLATYVYGNYIDEVLTMRRGGATHYYHQNSLWSVAAITDVGGAPVERYTYDSYGCPKVTDGGFVPVAENPWGTPRSAFANPWLFTSRQLDEETGLYFYRARSYDCAKGRFLQRDPLGHVDGANLYEYVRSNPTAFTDPTGTVVTCSVGQVSWVLGVGGSVAVLVCEDQWGNSAVFLSLQVAGGADIGASGQGIVIGKHHVRQLVGSGWNVNASAGPVSGQVIGEGGGGVTGGGGGRGEGLRYGLSVSAGETILLQITERKTLMEAEREMQAAEKNAALQKQREAEARARFEACPLFYCCECFGGGSAQLFKVVGQRGKGPAFKACERFCGALKKLPAFGECRDFKNADRAVGIITIQEADMH